MNKSVAIKLAIVLVVLAVVYNVFWFFKVGQVEKQVRKFVTENSSYVSVGDISVSGFPLSQKITVTDLKFTLPTALLDKRQTAVKKLEAKAGIFSSDFVVTLIETVTVQDIDNNVGTVEFSKEPEVHISIADGRISKFAYQDFGYRILDAEKNVIYAASSSVVSLDSTVDEAEKITNKITVNIKDIEGFDALDIYKNAFEKKVIDGLKTGEISIGAASTASLPGQIVDPNAPAPTAPVAPAPVNGQVAPVAPLAAEVAPAATPAAPVAAPASPEVAAAPAVEAPKPEEIANAVANNNLVKSNLMADLEYSLVPSSTEQAQIPTDPTQIQDAPIQYSKVVKVNNLEFSNPLYKILINGEMSTFVDDNMPSGSMTVKIEKIDNLINYVSSGLTQMVEKKAAATPAEAQPTDLVVGTGAITEDPYQNFLKRVSANLTPVTKELAAKNPVTKEDVAQIDIRREKNLDFLFNETTGREILGKF